MTRPWLLFSLLSLLKRECKRAFLRKLTTFGSRGGRKFATGNTVDFLKADDVCWWMNVLLFRSGHGLKVVAEKLWNQLCQGSFNLLFDSLLFECLSFMQHLQENTFRCYLTASLIPLVCLAANWTSKASKATTHWQFNFYYPKLSYLLVPSLIVQLQQNCTCRGTSAEILQHTLISVIINQGRPLHHISQHP